jgi:hypothetical protein
MAKIDKSNNNSNTSKRNSNNMPKGTMPKDKLVRFKLTGNIDNPGNYKHRSIADVKIVARSARAISTYRMYVHGCMENKLPSALRRSVHYFLTPMSRADSDNSKDRKDIVPVDNSPAEDNVDIVKA